MAERQPAVVIIARQVLADQGMRHGLRLDIADPSWQLSTPAPYDPPLTYGGWTQCQRLGMRIASLLHAREQENVSTEEHGSDHGSQEPPKKRRRIRHKVVIHSSPFLRCLQTSVAISAGMAQYKPSHDTSSGARRSSITASPRSRPMEGPTLSPLVEPDLAHTLARKALRPPKRYRKSEVRVDAWLGEWLNPDYYEQIMPPPPSAMMMTTAKAELMENEPVDIFAPAVSYKASGGSLWASANPTTAASRESTLDDSSPAEESAATSPLSPSRRRASHSHVESNIDRPQSPYRPGSVLQPHTSTLPKQEYSVYRPPQPQYAVSSSDQIPRGYVAHARNACSSVDYQWDSSRPPYDWGDGGEYGEGWSSMHKRFRRGLNHLIEFYSKEGPHAGNEAASAAEQAGRHSSSHTVEDDEQEDLVVVIVTHGAGCNALIGALTGHAVLIDVGMASLTVAVRKDDAPTTTAESFSTAHSPGHTPSPEQMYLRGDTQRTNPAVEASSMYDLKLVASTEHLRHVAFSPSMRSIEMSRNPFSERAHQHLGESSMLSKSNTSTALGSIRRRSAANALALASSHPGDQDLAQPTTPLSTGLWTPKAQACSPQTDLQSATDSQSSPDLTVSSSDSPDLLPAGGTIDRYPKDPVNAKTTESVTNESRLPTEDLARDSASPDLERSAHSNADTAGALPLATSGHGNTSELNGGLEQKGLWGAQAQGPKIERAGRETPKRRWTVDQE